MDQKAADREPSVRRPVPGIQFCSLMFPLLFILLCAFTESRFRPPLFVSTAPKVLPTLIPVFGLT